jgi:hypothetical protein
VARFGGVPAADGVAAVVGQVAAVVALVALVVEVLAEAGQVVNGNSSSIL